MLRKQLVAVAFLVLSFMTPFAAIAEIQHIKLTPEEVAFVAAHPVIKVANEMDWPPFDYNEFGKPKGMSIDYLKLVAGKAGLQVEFVNGYTWDELLKLFESKQLDVIPALYRNTEREAFTLFTPPYYKGSLGVFTHKNGVTIAKNADLLGKRVGIQTSHGAIPIIKQQIVGIEFVEHPNPAELVKMLATQKVDAIIGNPLLFDYFARENQTTDIQLSDYINMSVEEQLKTSLHVGVRKDYPVLHQILSKAMAATTDVEMAAIEGTWNRFQAQASRTISLTKLERDYLDTKGALNLCIDPQWMPYEFLSSGGRHDGLSGDYFKLFAKRIGVPINLHVTESWSDTLSAAQKRECDVIPLVNNTQDRSAYLNITNPYLSLPYVVATKNDQFFIENIEDELDKTFAVVRDYAVARAVQIKYPQIKLLEVDNIVEGLHKVSNREAFGYIGATAVIANAMRKEGLLDLKVAGKLSFGYRLGVATRNDEPLLNNIFQKAIDTLSRDEKERILNKWMAVNTETVVDYTLLWRFVVGGLVILLVFAYWNRKLKLAKRDLEGVQGQLEQQNKTLERLSITDPLTGLYNRGKLDEEILNEIARAERYGHQFGVMLLDIDYFKEVNDTHGHQVGDEVLVTIAKILKKQTRVNDIIGRWGGEEFVIICSETGREGILTLAENIRASIENYVFPVVGRKTSSFGLAMYQPGDDLDGLIANADKALYNAKADGRNCVKIF